MIRTEALSVADIEDAVLAAFAKSGLLNLHKTRVLFSTVQAGGAL